MTPFVVIPAYNEAPTLGVVVAAARAHAPVLVVDDGSDDASAAVAARAGAEVIRHPKRLGKGQAIRTGVAAARSRGATLVVTLDGDGQHDPADLAAVLDAARAAPRAIVVGSRLGAGAALPADRLNAIRVAGFFVSWASGLAVRDTQSGFRAYPVELFDDVEPRGGGFVFETEVLVAAAARGWCVREVPVTAIPRAARRSRFRPLRDGVAIGAYVAGRALARWEVEARAALGALGGPFTRERRRRRHAAMLEDAAPYAGAPGLWALAIGGSVLHRLTSELAGLWRHPRRRRAAVAALATLATPVLLPLLALQAVVGRRLPDVVSPLVARVCAQDRLEAAPAPGAPLVAPAQPSR